MLEFVLQRVCVLQHESIQELKENFICPTTWFKGTTKEDRIEGDESRTV
jgi:hypothetical protein